MSSEAQRAFTAMLAALSQATRIKIVEVVSKGGEEGVAAGDIARAVHCPASTLSFHLKELTQAGLLSPKPQGRFIRYGTRPESFDSLADFIRALPGPSSVTDTPASPSGKKKSRAGRRGRSAGDDTEGQLSIFGE